MSSEIRPVSGSRPALPVRTQENSSAPREGGANRAAATGGDGIRVETAPSADLGQVPINAERVGEIRSALQNGTYPILPTRIADAMIAARFLLSTAE